MGLAPSGSEKSGTDLLTAYIGHIGEKEPPAEDPNTFSPKGPRQASLLVARSCVLITRGDEKLAGRHLRSARDIMRPLAEQKRRGFDEQASLGGHIFHIANMLIDRDDPESPSAFQRVAHRAAVEELQRINKAIQNDPNPGRLGHLNGDRAEQLTLALLTRPVDMGVLTVRALAHHDRGHNNTAQANYDFLAVADVPEEETDMVTREAQLKDGCLDFCDCKKGRPRGNKERGGYTKKIMLMSGECDVHQGRAADLTAWLHDELMGNASPEVTETLDGITGSLAMTLVNPEPWRMGTQPA